MPRDTETMLDILNAARLVVVFRGQATEQDLIDDLKTQSAILHQIMIIGEAVKRLSPEFRTAHPEVPWSAIARMRDHLIHRYDSVDLAIVWQVASVNAPELIAALEPMVPPDPNEGA